MYRRCPGTISSWHRWHTLLIYFLSLMCAGAHRLQKRKNNKLSRHKTLQCKRSTNQFHEQNQKDVWQSFINKRVT